MTASLDPLESTVERDVDPSLPQTRYGANDFDSLPPASAAEQRAAHSTWAQERQWIFAALQRTGTPQRALAAFAGCGGNLWLGMQDNEPVLHCNSCHSRHCQTCARKKRAALVAATAHKLKSETRRCRFITLTLRCSQTPLNDQIDRLYESFRRLRQRAWWKKNVDGGVAFFEVKLGENSGAWHVHFHALATVLQTKLIRGEEVPWLDTYELAEQWHAVTGDSFIVHVKPVDHVENSAAYAAKYATKPLHPNVIQSPRHLDECITALRGRRLIKTFGTWDGMDAEEPEPPAPTKMIGNVEQLMSAANSGDADAIRWVEVIHRKWPTLLPRMRYACPLDGSPSP